MDELDQERSTAQALAAAGAAAALFAGLALAITRKRAEPDPLTAAGRATEAVRASAPAEEAGRLAEQVAAPAPDVLGVLEQHAPDAVRRLRDRLPALRRTQADLAATATAAGERVSDLAGSVGDRIEEAAVAAKRGGDRGDLDLSALTPAQAAAARAAAAAVAKAEQALGAVGSAGSRSRETGQEAAEDVAQSLREVVHQAAEAALELWQQARSRVATASEEGATGENAANLSAAVAGGAQDASQKAREAASEAAARAQGIADDVADKARGLGDKAHDLGDKAKKGARDAAESTVETSKESISALAWLVAAITVVVYVLLKPERRESLTRFADEAVIQVQELLRDLRGYDDEF